MSPRIALVSCVKSKRRSPAPAADLYTSALFRSLRQYAVANADRWFILSAEHGLLDPQQIIAPYERTLNRMRRSERLAWAKRVQEQLLASLPPRAEIIMLAGSRYREELMPFLKDRGYTVSVPLEGLSFGKQLQRLKALNLVEDIHLPSAPRRARITPSVKGSLADRPVQTRLSYASRSTFLATVTAALEAAPERLATGRAIQIALRSGGYDGEYLIRIDFEDDDAFRTDWMGADETRFPARIRAAATALRSSGLSGLFRISHRSGRLEIAREPEAS